MKKLKTVFCGAGKRARMLNTSVMSIDAYELVAVCDPYEDKAESLAEIYENKKGTRPAVYTDHVKMLDEQKPDCAIVATSWEAHVEVAIDCMRRGIAVAMEVGGAYNAEECYDLVRTQEETGVPFMFLENCCYNKDEMLATSLARNGKFGKIMYCSGAYAHTLLDEIAYGDKTRHYRLRNYMHRNCENYPTHELGPIAKLLNINRGNRMVSLVSRCTGSASLHEFVQDREGLEYLRDFEFKQADIVETMITCENGELITIRLDTTLPRLYSRELVVRGTKGLYNQSSDMVFIDCPEFDHTNCSLTLPDGSVINGMMERRAYRHYEENSGEYSKYLPKMWQEITPEILAQGHGGMDYFIIKEFADCLTEGREMPIDVYDAAAWMSITYLSEISLKTGMPVEIPDFTHGLYKTREQRDVVEFPRID